jgi:hypothetical protein
MAQVALSAESVKKGKYYMYNVLLTLFGLLLHMIQL